MTFQRGSGQTATFVASTLTAPARFATIAAMSAGLVAGAGSAAQAQSLCTEYTVQRGDTLGEIAAAAGVAGGFQRLFDANRNVLSSPNLIEVGDVLQIPCEDGSLPTSTPAVVAEAVATSALTPRVVPDVATDRPVRFLTASGYAPFTDEALPEGGFFTALVRRAMDLGNPDQDYNVIFVNDWGAHLTDLLPSGAFDGGFPWFLPDCENVGNLSPSNAMRCTEFDASAPFYDALVGYYTLNGSPYADATVPEDLFGARICRPDGWFSFDLEARQLVAPNIELTFAANEEACWQLLLEGEIDVITYDKLPADEDYTELGISDRVAVISPLTTSETLHVFIPKSNPNSAEYLAILDAGLEELRLSGEWFEIVRTGIQETIEN